MSQQLSDAPSIVGPGHNLATTTDILRDRFADLMEEVEKLARAATEARGQLGAAAEITADEQVSALVKIGIDAGKLSKRIDETRLATTKPLRDEVTETNRFFETLSTRMDNVKSAFERIVGAWDRRKRDEERRRAAEAARHAEEEAARKLAEAEAASSSIESDVILNEAAEADERARLASHVALSAGSGPTKTEGGMISASAPWTFAVEDWAKIDLRELRDSFTVAEIEKAVRAHIRKHKNTRPLAGVRIFQEETTRFRG